MASILIQIIVVWIISLLATKFVWKIKQQPLDSSRATQLNAIHHSSYNDSKINSPKTATTGGGLPCCSADGTSNHRDESPSITLESTKSDDGRRTLASYPNPLGISPVMREKFHPVIQMNKECTTILDLSEISGQSQLITKENQESFIQSRKQRSNEDMTNNDNRCYTIGKYDENRVNLYSSDLFQDEDHSIDGYDGARTLHVGIDLGGPVGENVYSFWDGHVHSVGYNADLGDYGYVVVVEYDMTELIREQLEKDHVNSCTPDNGRMKECKHEPNRSNVDGMSICMDGDANRCRFWALYGHLDASTVQLNFVGKRIQRGDILGHIGDVHENGGWSIPHVHFQLSTFPPKTHDLPGAVTMKDRERALVDFPDPRFILGELY